MKSYSIVTIIGARPQFIKAAALSRALISFNKQSSAISIEEKIIHTGQHYDEKMSEIFFDQLKIPHPMINLEVGSGSHGQQTGQMLERIEQVLIQEKPDWVLIYGDTNSTLAGALAAVKLHIPVAHVEAGLRSFNRVMPEEINRIISDCLSTLLFCPTETAVHNLSSEGILNGVYQIGDVMYDSVLYNAELAEKSSTILHRLAVHPKSYYLATLHRAENTDNTERCRNIISAFQKLDYPIIFPIHPRTLKILQPELDSFNAQMRPIDPVSYLDMLMLEKNARMILTDSGGVQKEAYWFNIPCVTLRDETEWVELLDMGCNVLAGADTIAILKAVNEFETSSFSLTNFHQQLYGDGHSAEKIIEVLTKFSINNN
jgi:UDP-GlcNAc3NAcA epimerase